MGEMISNRNGNYICKIKHCLNKKRNGRCGLLYIYKGTIDGKCHDYKPKEVKK